LTAWHIILLADKRLAGTSALQTFIYQFVVLKLIKQITLKYFEQKYLLLSGFTLEVVGISPICNILCMNEMHSSTFELHKVVRQQNSGAVENFILPYSAVIDKSKSERITEIGPHLPKLSEKEKWPSFFDSQCR